MLKKYISLVDLALRETENDAQEWLHIASQWLHITWFLESESVFHILLFTEIQLIKQNVVSAIGNKSQANCARISREVIKQSNSVK